jgi:hypothetical protein
VKKGFHRVAWDLRQPPPVLPKPAPPGADEDLFRTPEVGPLVLPGKYRVRLLIRQEGKTRAVEGASQEFAVVLDGESKTPGHRKALLAFQQQVTALKRTVAGALQAAQTLRARLTAVRRAIDQTPKLGAKERARVNEMERRLRLIDRELRGDVALRRRNENTPLSISEKVEAIIDEQQSSLAAPTKTHRMLYEQASADLTRVLGQLRTLKEKDLKALEKVLDEAGAPYTPGRLPGWQERD